MVEIRGPGVVATYLVPGRPSAVTSARGPYGWLRTGDLGQTDRDGFVYLVGRADDVINRLRDATKNVEGICIKTGESWRSYLVKWLISRGRNVQHRNSLSTVFPGERILDSVPT